MKQNLNYHLVFFFNLFLLLISKYFIDCIIRLQNFHYHSFIYFHFSIYYNLHLTITKENSDDGRILAIDYIPKFGIKLMKMEVILNLVFLKNGAIKAIKMV